MGEQTKQVRVDNWGIFFLQRLQMFFSKTDYCDLTLQFEGNVQLKVHRLVMNACTEYFKFLEQTCSVEENIIMMPSDLQADVIVPIVNFMYTGMLEFHLVLFEKLYRTAQLMNIQILVKLLEAQRRQAHSTTRQMRKRHYVDVPVNNSASVPAAKKASARASSSMSDLPATLPGRKVPVWKRKTAPGESRKSSGPSSDPLSLTETVPRPTRFEWPDDDLSNLPLMESTFEDVSLTSKPLLTLQDCQDVDEVVRNTKNAARIRKKGDLDSSELKRRRSVSFSEDDPDDPAEADGKSYISSPKKIFKKVRFEESADGKTTTINITTDGLNADTNHETLIAEILKKYPEVMKKSKNIRLKIVTKANNIADKSPELAEPPVKSKTFASSRNIRILKQNAAIPAKIIPENDDSSEKEIWVCEQCSTVDEPMEFVLYYLYRKHMTDVHNEKIDPKSCKYCGLRCNKHNVLVYHLYVKHGMRPPSKFDFPKCDLCPYIALSPKVLMRHKLKHSKNEKQCVECKLTFSGKQSLTSHMQITGHLGKTRKTNCDCQYCTKKFHNPINLFSHVKSQHRNEARRDGIVSIDESDDDFDDEDDEEEEDEENSKDEYILPEIVSHGPVTRSAKAKVNILSNVKVQERVEENQPITLEPSSEAEALNNVASGIATSLGLVDIVVLNENQQLYLQSNQENYTGENSEQQSEFIIPELSSRGEFVQGEGQVITQSMIAGGDIGSTDELVMVLTDHDYGDNQEDISSENSNIVVLYSHPVDGSQEQFITSQGNITVNSETGMIEIHNGSQDSNIESIEMIQREIESGGSSSKQAESTLHEKAQENAEKDEEMVKMRHVVQSEELVETLRQGQQLEFIAASNEAGPEVEQQPTENPENLEESSNVSDEAQASPEDEEVEDNNTEDVSKENTEETEIDGVQENDEENRSEEQISEEIIETNGDEEHAFDTETQSEQPVEHETEEECKEPEAVPGTPEHEHQMIEMEEVQHEIEINQDDNNESDEVSKNPPDEHEEEHVECGEDQDSSIDKNTIDNTVEEVDQELSSQQSDETSINQFADENSQSSRDSRKSLKKDSNNVSAQTLILDDWEDTDSQQSASNIKGSEDEETNGSSKGGDVTVNKLMDDWEDEDDENKE